MACKQKLRFSSLVAQEKKLDARGHQALLESTALFVPGDDNKTSKLGLVPL